MQFLFKIKWMRFQTKPNRYCVFRFEGPMEELQAFNPLLNQFIKDHKVKVTILEKGEC